MTDIERLCERLDAATKARFRQSTLDIADHEDSHVTVKLIKEASLALRQSEQKAAQYREWLEEALNMIQTEGEGSYGKEDRVAAIRKGMRRIG